MPTTPRNRQLVATVCAIGCGHSPKTCEVVDASGTQHTIWFAGHRIDDTVVLEQRMGPSGPYWADINTTGSRN